MTGRSAPIAVLLSRFPKVTETFITREILELRRQGEHVELFSLIRENEPVVQPDMTALACEATYAWPPRWELVASQLHWLRHAPRRYLRAWRRTLAGNAWSLRFLARAFFVVPAAALFARHMQARGVRHVHAHWATHPALAALVIKELTSIPYSLRPHAQDLYVDRTMLNEKLAGAEFIATISDYNRALIAGTYGPDVATKTFVVRYGIDTAEFRRPADDGNAGPDFEILCIASLQPYKGHRYLLEACAELVAEGVPARCTLVGDGEERPGLEGMMRSLDLEDHVRFLGRQTVQRVRELLASSDVMVLPSVVADDGTMEGLPNALIEAMAMEVPVVTTRISAITELVEDGTHGYTVPERDAHALAEAMRRLYRAPDDRRAFGRAGREKVLLAHDLEANVADLRRLLNGSTG